MMRAVVLLPVLMLAGCGSRSDDRDAISPEEDRMLNEAAAAIDVNALTSPDDQYAPANLAAPDVQPGANSVAVGNAQ